MDEPATKTRPRRRWLVFSLKSLLVFITLLAIVAAWVANERSQSRREMKIAQQFEAEGASITFAGPYDVLFARPEDRSWWQRLTESFLGSRAQMLWHGGIRVDDISPIAKLTNLRWLYLGGTESNDLAPLAELKELQILELDDNPVSDLSSLSALKNLEELSLEETRVSDLVPVGALSRLEKLDLGSTNVEDLSPLAALKSLRVLQINDTQVRDLSPLVGLSALEHLDVGETQVNEKEIQLLQQALPNCRIHRSSRSTAP